MLLQEVKTQYSVRVIAYLPSLTFISVATLAATDMAATLRGCVHPILPVSQQFERVNIEGMCILREWMKQIGFVINRSGLDWKWVKGRARCRLGRVNVLMMKRVKEKREEEKKGEME